MGDNHALERRQGNVIRGAGRGARICAGSGCRAGATPARGGGRQGLGQIEGNNTIVQMLNQCGGCIARARIIGPKGKNKRLFRVAVGLGNEGVSV
jgi:hypothetical protein